MILAGLLAFVLVLQTPVVATPETEETNVFLDLGREHCATEIAFAAYEQPTEDAVATNTLPAYVTYSAFQFESADQARAALEDVPVLVAETFSNDPNLREAENFDRLVNEVDSEDYGDETIAYTMTLPVDNEALDNVLTVELLGIVKHDQLLVILMFSGTGPTRTSPALTLDTIPPFADDLDEDWDGTGELKDALPDEEALPPGWEGREVTLEDPPSC